MPWWKWWPYPPPYYPVPVPTPAPTQPHLPDTTGLLDGLKHAVEAAAAAVWVSGLETGLLVASVLCILWLLTRKKP